MGVIKKDIIFFEKKKKAQFVCDAILVMLTIQDRIPG